MQGGIIMSRRSRKEDPNRLGVGRLLAFKSSDVSAAGVQAIVLGFLSIYCSDTLGLSTMVVGTILMVTKIIDAFTDIAAGFIVDNTNTKLGKGRPYELCIIGQTVCTWLLFSTNSSWSTPIKYAWVTCMYVLVFAIFATLRNAANTPYTIRAFSNNNVLITKLASYGGIITMLCSIVISTTFPIVMGRLATSAAGWSATLAIFMVPLTLIGILRFIFIKEDPSVDAGHQGQKISISDIFTMFKRNKYIWLYAGIMLCYNITTSLGVGTYYFKWIVGNPAMQSVMAAVSIIMLPLMFGFPAVMKKIGSLGNMVAIFSCIGAVGYGIMFFAKANIPVFLVGALLSGLANLPLSYYAILFIMRCCTYNEMLGMSRMDGSTNILANFMAKVGGALGSFITGTLLAVAGYIKGTNVAVQPDSALLMIRLLQSFVPAILLLIVALCARKFVALEKEIPEWEAKQAALKEN